MSYFSIFPIKTMFSMQRESKIHFTPPPPSPLQIYQDVKHRNRRQMSMSRHSATATQQARRKQEDNLAVVFMGIVLVFLICHSPRLGVHSFFLPAERRSMNYESCSCCGEGGHQFRIPPQSEFA